VKKKYPFSFDLRPGGFGFGFDLSSAAAAIIYDGTLLNIASECFLKDVGAYPQDNAPAYASNMVYQNGIDNKVVVPLDCSLSNEKYNNTIQVTGTGSSASDLGGGDWKIIFDTSAVVKFILSESEPTSEVHLVEFTADIVLGNMSITGYHDGSSFIPFNVPIIVTQGINEINCKNRSGTNEIYFVVSGASSSEINLTDNSVKEITAVNTKSLLYYSPEDKEFKVIADGSVGESLLLNGEFNDGTTNWTPKDTTDIFETRNNALYMQTTIEDSSTHCRTYQKFNKQPEKNKTYSFGVNLIQALLKNTYTPVANQFRVGWATNIDSQPIQIIASNDLESTTTGMLNVPFVFTSDYNSNYGIVIGGRDDVAILEVDDTYIRESLPISIQYNLTKSFGELLTLNVLVEQTDIDYLNAYPNALREMWTEKKLHPALSFDRSDMVTGQGYYPANDFNSGQYVQNVAVELGSELTGNELPYSSNTVSRDGSTVTLNIVDNQSGFYDDAIMNINDLAILSFTILSYTGSGGQIVLSLGSDNHWVALDAAVRVEVNAGTSTRIRFSGLELGTEMIIKYSLIPVSHYSEIQNYTSACRDTYKSANYGASDLIVKQDATGRIIGAGDGMEFNGKAYANPGYVFPNDEDWYIEIVMNILNDGSYHLMGVIEASSNLTFGEYAYSDKVRVQSPSGSLYSPILVDGKHHFILGKVGSNLTLYTDGQSGENNTGNIFTNILPFFIGKQNGADTNQITSSLPLFKIHKNTTVTQALATKAYNDAVAKGLLS